MPKDKGKALGIALVLLLVLHHIPFKEFLLYPLMLFDTLMHESGHGLTALLLGGNLAKLEIFTDGSGVAWTATSGGLMQAAVAAGGLLGPPAMAFFAFFTARFKYGPRIWLLSIGMFVLVTLTIFVRGGTAWPYLLVTGLALVGTGWKASRKVTEIVTLMVACELSVLTWTRSDYLFTPSAVVNGQINNSDVGGISLALGLPYWFWGFWLSIVSLVLIGAGIKVYLRKPREKAAK